MHDFAKNTIGSFYMSRDISRYSPVAGTGIAPLSSSLHYSNALFEGMSIIGVRKGQSIQLGLFHPNLNFERMRHGMSELGIGWELYSDELIIESIFTICALNKWNLNIGLEGVNTLVSNEYGKYQRIYVRPLVYAANNAIGLGAKQEYGLLLCLVPMGDYLSQQSPEGMNTMLHPKPRTLAFPTLKVASNYQLSMQGQAALAKYNSTNDIRCGEVVFANRNGNITEGSGENIVMVRDNELITPPLSEGALPGITYRIVFQIAEEMGIRTRFGTFKYGDIDSADALFFTGNAAGLIPIKKVVKVDENYSTADYMETREGGRNALFRKLQAEYMRISLGDTTYGNYFTYLDEWIDESRLAELNTLGDDFRKSLADENTRYEGTNTSVNSFITLNPKVSIGRKYFDDKKWILERLGLRHYL